MDWKIFGIACGNTPGYWIWSIIFFVMLTSFRCRYYGWCGENMDYLSERGLFRFYLINWTKTIRLDLTWLMKLTFIVDQMLGTTFRLSFVLFCFTSFHHRSSRGITVNESKIFFGCRVFSLFLPGSIKNQFWVFLARESCLSLLCATFVNRMQIYETTLLTSANAYWLPKMLSHDL